MQLRLARGPKRFEGRAAGHVWRLVWAVLLFLPVILLLVATLREDNWLLWLGTVLQGIACLLFLLNRGDWTGSGLLILYVVALGWLFFGTTQDDWFLHLSKASLLVIPLLLFAFQVLNDSGALALRQARALARRLASRSDLPNDLQAIRQLAEVKAFREALHIDAGPALDLLNHPRPSVRIAALAALDFRQNWRYGQAEMVLHQAQTGMFPEMRAAAISALANVDDRYLVETLASFLSDPSPVVRQATSEALLWNGDRWKWVKLQLRKALSDPILEEDGPLPFVTQEMVEDLSGWAAEKGVLGIRSALSLGAYFRQTLAANPDEAILDRLRRQLADPLTPSCLRMEFAQILQEQNALTLELLRHLLGSATPSPIRLLAADILLGQGLTKESKDARVTLLELARMSNRELALMTAEVIQRRLGVDLGLSKTEPVSVRSRQAADVARRVLQWAIQADAENRAGTDASSASSTSASSGQGTDTEDEPAKNSGAMSQWSSSVDF